VLVFEYSASKPFSGFRQDFLLSHVGLQFLLPPSTKMNMGDMVKSFPPAGNAFVLATASAFPPNFYTQEEMLEAFVSHHQMTEKDLDFTQRVFRNCMFDTCSVYLNKEDLFRKMTKNEYMDHIKPKLFDMSLRATKQAIAEWGGNVETITHIVWGTMTGSIAAPTMDIRLAHELGLSPFIQRLSVESMGCLTGYRCLALAADIAKADPRHIVLVVVADVRSALGNQLSRHEPFSPVDRANVIASALFRDSAGAAIVSSNRTLPSLPATMSLPEPRLRSHQYEVVGHVSMLIPETEQLVKYREYDDSVIHLFIDRVLPDYIYRHAGAIAAQLLQPRGLNTEDCSFMVHTGGPKILNSLQAAFKVPIERFGSSWYVMKKHGNLSGSSNLVVLDHAQRLGPENGFEDKEWYICMSFGPGVGVEALLLRRYIV